MAQVYNSNRLKVYTPEEIDHCEKSKYIKRYVDAGRTRAVNSGVAYKHRLQAFSQFVFKKMDGREVDDLITDLQAGRQVVVHDGSGPQEMDIFDMLNELLKFLRERKGESKLSANVINAMIRTTKKFLKFSKVKIDNEEFLDRVQLLRKEKAAKKGIEKGDIVKLLNACKNIRLKTALHGFSAKGPRPIELCAVRNRDVDLGSKTPTITFRAEFSKMREARTRPLTIEEATQYRMWKKWKYRERRTTLNGKVPGTYVHEVITPKENPDDLFFAHVHFGDGRQEVTPEGLYTSLQTEFGELVDMVDGDKVRNASNGRARDISLKVFRDFVKSTISDAGHADYSEWYIGHSGSTYYQKSERERMEIFRKMEPYLTYLDISGLEARAADVDTRIEQVQAENKNLKKTSDLALRGTMLTFRVLQATADSVERAGLLKQLEDNNREIFQLIRKNEEGANSHESS